MLEMDNVPLIPLIKFLPETDNVECVSDHSTKVPVINMSCGAQTTKPIKNNNVSFTLCSLRHTFDFNLTFELPKLPVYLSVANRHQGLVQNDKAVNWLSIGDSVIGLSLGLMHLIWRNPSQAQTTSWSLTWITISEEGSCKHVCHS